MADASRYLLRSRISITLAPGDAGGLPHGLKVAGVPVAPSDVTPDRATPIVVDDVDTENVYLSNPSDAEQTAAFYCLYVWSGQAAADALEPNLWKGAAAGGGGGGVSELVDGESTTAVETAPGIWKVDLSGRIDLPRNSSPVSEVGTAIVDNDEGLVDVNLLGAGFQIGDGMIAGAVDLGFSQATPFSPPLDTNSVSIAVLLEEDGGGPYAITVPAGAQVIGNPATVPGKKLLVVITTGGAQIANTVISFQPCN